MLLTHAPISSDAKQSVQQHSARHAVSLIAVAKSQIA